MKLSLIVPAYNEEACIEKTIKSYISFFDFVKQDFEINVIIEGVDNTAVIVAEVAKKDARVNYVVSDKRLGKGGAIIRGIQFASGDLIGFVDADGATPPESYYELVKNIGDLDCAIASRRVFGSRIINQRPLLQRLGSIGFNLLVRFMFGLRFKDTQCGAKLFKREAIHTVLKYLHITGWAFDVNLLYSLKALGYRVAEVPTIWIHRKDGAKFNFARFFWKIVPVMLLALIRLRLKHKINNS